jgi:hypothetical protein
VHILSFAVGVRLPTNSRSMELLELARRCSVV